VAMMADAAHGRVLNRPGVASWSLAVVRLEMS